MSTNQNEPPDAEKDNDSAVVRAINAGAEKAVTAIANQADSFRVRSLRNLLTGGRSVGVAYIVAATIPIVLDITNILTTDAANALKALKSGAGILAAIGLLLMLACSYDMNRGKS